MTPAHHTPRPTARAFSLVELLVVILIIVVLLTILVPSLSQALDDAARTHCLSNIRNQIIAQSQYAMDHNRRYAPHDDFSPDYQRSGNTPNIVQAMRGTYIQDTDIMICPIVAEVPAQDNGEFRSNDWQANGIFGGWNTDASYTNTAYMWLANFDGTRMFDAVPAPPSDNAPDDLSVNNTVRGVRMLNGEAPIARTMGQADQRKTFVTHKINFFVGRDAVNLQDVGHGGRGTWQNGPLYDGYQTTEQPVGFADGHVITRPRSEILPRMNIGGNYPDDPGAIGTFLW